ncbi:MAG: hypothetical protein P1V20_10575 [Verrucomicrobiales bacterium]|nr:hypothetical protein [Verrucomicrobiales bacterium]
MRRFLPLSPVVCTLLGLVSIAAAQQGNLPADSSGSLKPIIPAPADANVPTPNSSVVQGTLQTTTVQSNQPLYNPAMKVTADRYYDLLGTTGSYRVNTDRAKDLQEEAIQRARRQKRIKEQMSTVRHYRIPSDSGSAAEFLKENPPHPNPPPLSESSDPEPSSGEPAAGATYPDSENETSGMPPEPEITYIKMPGSGGSLAARLRAKKARNAPPESAPDFSDALADGPVDVGNQSAPAPSVSNVPMPPQNVFRSRGPSADDVEQEEQKKGLFGLFRKTGNTESPAADPIPPVEPSVSAAMVSDTPLAPEYPASDIPSFSTAPSVPDLTNSAASDALVKPPEKKTLFSMFGKKKSPEPAPGSNNAAPSPSSPPPVFQPYSPPPAPKPTLTSIFRPNASAKKANAYSLVQGEEVFATVGGEQVKLTKGTRVRVLRTGTEKSLVRLYDNRQATIANSALVPEEE